MAGKRLVVIGVLMLGSLMAAPRPAQAQWLDVMKWLSSLDPKQIEGGGFNMSLWCKNAHGESRVAPYCSDELVGKRAKALKILGEPPTVRTSIGISYFFGEGQHNMNYPTNNPGNRITVEVIKGTIDYRVSRLLDIGVGVGNAHMTVGTVSPDKLIVSPRFVFHTPPIRTDTVVLQFVFGLEFEMFPQGIDVRDFGATPIPGAPTTRGKWETVPAISFGISFGMAR